MSGTATTRELPANRPKRADVAARRATRHRANRFPGRARMKACPPWCNGSTSDFGSDGPGSNPGGGAAAQRRHRRLLAEQQVQHEQDDEQRDQATAFLSTAVGQNQSDCSCHRQPPQTVRVGLASPDRVPRPSERHALPDHEVTRRVGPGRSGKRVRVASAEHRRTAPSPAGTGERAVRCALGSAAAGPRRRLGRTSVPRASHVQLLHPSRPAGAAHSRVASSVIVVPVSALLTGQPFFAA